MTQIELLSPAGDVDSLQAALAAGANAVYFGLNTGFNARARATNFSLTGLPKTVEKIHNCGAKAYVTVNTLVFENELDDLAALLDHLGQAKVDAIIVQDPAVALLAKEHCPNVALHASTQMTLSCPEAAAVAQSLGFTRVVVPRELSLEEIEDYAKHSELDLEVFILGSLCISFSGQCLASLAWGGRSANRGQCAQACRLPYRLLVDGQLYSEQSAHLMSACDLAGFLSAKKLRSLKVKSLKIEGRLKSANYVYTATKTLRDWLDMPNGQSAQLRLRSNYADLCTTFSRGFGPGWLSGIDHQQLINTRLPKHRGLLLGRVSAVQGRSLWLELSGSMPANQGGKAAVSRVQEHRSLAASTNPASIWRQPEEVLTAFPMTPQKGMGILLLPPADRANDPRVPTLGGPIFDVTQNRGQYRLTFGHLGPNLQTVTPGWQVYITSAPAVQATVQQALKSDLVGRLPVQFTVFGQIGQPLKVVAKCSDIEVIAQSKSLLSQASHQSLTAEVLEEKLSTLGSTPYYLDTLDSQHLAADLFLPLSELKPIRRQIVEELIQASTVQQPADHPEVKLVSSDYAEPGPALRPRSLVILCRTPAQLRAALQVEPSACILEHRDLAILANMLDQCQEAGGHAIIACPRVQKPSEQHLIESLLKLKAPGYLTGNLGTIATIASVCAALPNDERCEIHGDFGLNAANSLTVKWLLSLGLTSLTVAEDLNIASLEALAASLADASKQRLITPVYRHLPVFHTQHCLYAQWLSQGHNNRSCGQPCRQHSLELEDRLQQRHQVITDMACRNTVFDCLPTTSQANLDILFDQHLDRWRLDFTNENYAQALDTLNTYQGYMRQLETNS